MHVRKMHMYCNEDGKFILSVEDDRMLLFHCKFYSPEPSSNSEQVVVIQEGTQLQESTSPEQFFLLAQGVDLLQEDSCLTLFEEDELYLSLFLKCKYMTQSPFLYRVPGIKKKTYTPCHYLSESSVRRKSTQQSIVLRFHSHDNLLQFWEVFTLSSPVCTGGSILWTLHEPFRTLPPELGVNKLLGTHTM